ncbi:MAG: GMC family oxidoreductase [Sphingomonas fennica]
MIGALADRSAGAPIAADICIVGAGAVGIPMALELAAAGRSVLLLEAGGEAPDPATDDLYRGAVADPRLHSLPEEYRARRLGGSTTLWGGRCMPLDPIDFEARGWIPDSGWPIGPDAVAPFYPAANRWAEAGEFAYTTDAAFHRPIAPMIAGFAGPHFTDDRLERFSCPTDFGRRYRHRLAAAARVTMLLGANVTAVRLNEAGTAVTALDVATIGGVRHRVEARQVVLAMGGLETTRLLLASRDVMPAGVGNGRDVLGRYYMCHVAGTIGTVTAPGAVHHGYDVAEDGTYCRRRLALTADAQRRHRIGNVVARLHHPRISDARHGSAALSALYLGRAAIPAHYRKRLEDADPAGARGLLSHIANVATGLPDLARFLRQMLVERRLADRKFPSIIVAPKDRRYSLDVHAEQEPNRASRLTLTDARDALGMPRLLIDWRYTAGDIRTVRTALGLLAADLRAAGGSLDYDEGAVEMEMTRYGAYGGHHIGTARMGTDPATSVVDAECRVHGIANLHLAGAAVFPHLQPGQSDVDRDRARPAPRRKAGRMMRVLVLGAGGFVGARVSQALAAADWADPVRGQRRPAPGALVVDTLKADDLARALDGVDAVVNCVAGSAEAIGQGAAALFAAAGGRRVVHLSSMAVYGDATGDVTEDRPFARGHGAYGDAKIAAEEAAAGHDAVILRPGCIYGPGSAQWTWRPARLLAAGRLGDLGANGDGLQQSRQHRRCRSGGAGGAAPAGRRTPRLQSRHGRCARLERLSGRLR